MAELLLTLRGYGRVVDSRQVRLRGRARLGECPGSLYRFPGGLLDVAEVGAGVLVGQRLLQQGESLRLGWGDIELEVALVSEARRGWSGPALFHGPLLAGAGLMVVSMMWLQAVGALWPTRAPAPLGPLVEVQLQEPGPQAHRPDDERSGVAWTHWYRQGIPDERRRIYDARHRLEQSPQDAAALRAVAHGCYLAEDWSCAAELYRRLSEGGEEPELLLALGRSRERLGDPQAAVDSWQRLLRQEPRHSLALAGLAISHQRLGQSAEAEAALAQAGPPQAMVDLARAIVAALRGEEGRAWREMELALRLAAALRPDDRLELRRSLALDPALAALRADPRLRTLVERAFGEAPPALWSAPG